MISASARRHAKTRLCSDAAPVYTPRMEWDEEIDARGLLCPLPVLKARKRLNAMTGGAILRLVATDPASVVDVPHFCAEGGHELVNSTTLQGETPAPAHVFLIRKATA